MASKLIDPDLYFALGMAAGAGLGIAAGYGALGLVAGAGLGLAVGAAARMIHSR